jgi:hypothetical protein
MKCLKSDFSTRPKKRELENFRGKQVKEKGGLALLTGLDVKSHLKDFGHILLRKSPIIIIEKEKQTFDEILYSLVMTEAYYKIKLYHGSFFKVLRQLENKIRSFRYIHFDSCCTAKILAKENIIADLTWLAQSNIVKRKFYFDITGSIRNGGPNNHVWLVEQVIPHIFRKAGFEVENCTMGGWSKYTFLETYSDGCPMWTAFYKFSK